MGGLEFVVGKFDQKYYALQVSGGWECTGADPHGGPLRAEAVHRFKIGLLRRDLEETLAVLAHQQTIGRDQRVTELVADDTTFNLRARSQSDLHRPGIGVYGISPHGHQHEA